MLRCTGLPDRGYTRTSRPSSTERALPSGSTKKFARCPADKRGGSRSRALVHRPRLLALRPPEGALLIGPRPPARMAVHLRHGLSQRPRRLDLAALRNLYSLRGLHHAGPCRDDPALQRHAVVLVDGVRPRGRLDACAADEPVSARVSPSREAHRRRRRIAHPGLRLPRRRTPVGHRDSGSGLPARAAGVYPCGVHAGRDRAFPVLARAPARELRECDELRDLPDVLCLLRALPALAYPGGERAALHYLPRESVHPCGRDGAPRSLRLVRAGFHVGRARNDARVLRACGSGLQSGPRHDGAARRPEGRSPMTPKLTLAVVWMTLLASATIAQPRPDPDWPCVQRKVPTISAGAVWSGPDPAGAGEWGKDFEAAALAQKLASRRTSLEEADQLVEAFAKHATQDKAQRLTRVFAGVLELINTERDRVLHGIERYARGQRRLADRVRDESDRISAVKDSPGAETTENSRALESQFAWDRRIFEERSQALTYVCETPVLLEQRLFEIARRIQARLP